MRDGLINLEHLLFLTEPITIDGRDAAIVHIYSEHPEYEWVDAAGEGIAAVDDVARAAGKYLRPDDLITVVVGNIAKGAEN